MSGVEVTPRILDGLGAQISLPAAPFARREIPEARMRPGFVVVLEPGGDRGLRLFEGLGAMLPDAFELERAHERFGHAVLLGRVGQDEAAPVSRTLG